MAARSTATASVSPPSPTLSPTTRERLARVRRLSDRLQQKMPPVSLDRDGNSSGLQRRRSAPTNSLSTLRVRVLQRHQSDVQLPYSPIRAAGVKDSAPLKPSPIKRVHNTTNGAASAGAGSSAAPAASAPAASSRAVPPPVPPPTPPPPEAKRVTGAAPPAPTSAASSSSAAPPSAPRTGDAGLTPRVSPLKSAVASDGVPAAANGTGHRRTQSMSAASTESRSVAAEQAAALNRRVVAVSVQHRERRPVSRSVDAEDDALLLTTANGSRQRSASTPAQPQQRRRRRWKSKKLAVLVRTIKSSFRLKRKKGKRKGDGSGDDSSGDDDHSRVLVARDGGSNATNGSTGGPSSAVAAAAAASASRRRDGRSAGLSIAVNANAQKPRSVKDRPPTPHPSSGIAATGKGAHGSPPTPMPDGSTPRADGFPGASATRAGAGAGAGAGASEAEAPRGGRFARHRNSISLASPAVQAARQRQLEAAKRLAAHPVASPLQADVADATGETYGDGAASGMDPREAALRAGRHVCFVDDEGVTHLAEPHHRSLPAARVKGILKVKSHTARVRRAGPRHRRLVFADTKGGDLCEVWYADNLHYSRRNRKRFWFF